MKLEIGQVIDRFVVERVLGSGGTAIVYLVRDRTEETYHALKVLSVSSPAIRERMRREGEVQSALSHPNIVPVRDVIDLDGSPALVMEYIEGPSLEAALRRYRLTLGDAELLFAGILAGVHAAHEAELVHRDLKPANVLLASTVEGFVPKVTDFGLAKIMVDIPGMAHTRAGISMGTPSYMAPEQIRDAGSVDQRADIWSLGCLLYELMTRQRAFPGDEALAIYNAVVDASFTPPREWVPSLPDRVNDAILGCLQLEADDRIPDCQSLLDVLSGKVEWTAQTAVLRRDSRSWPGDEGALQPEILDDELPTRFEAQGALGEPMFEPGEDTIPLLPPSAVGLSPSDLNPDVTSDDLVTDDDLLPAPEGVVRVEDTAMNDYATAPRPVRLVERIPSKDLPMRVRRPRTPTPSRRIERSAPRDERRRLSVMIGLTLVIVLVSAAAIGASASVIGMALSNEDNGWSTMVGARQTASDATVGAPEPELAVLSAAPTPAPAAPPPAPPPAPQPAAEVAPVALTPAPAPPRPVPQPAPPPAPPEPAGGMAAVQGVPVRNSIRVDPQDPASNPLPSEYNVLFTSNPLAAKLFIDGRPIGRTPRKMGLPRGNYQIRMESADQIGTFDVTIAPGKAAKFCYKFDDARRYEGLCP